MTSIRRSSVRELWVFKSRSRTLVQTDAPASRQMRAIALSIATPLTAELRSEGMLPGGPPMDPASGGICIWLACVARGAGVAATTKPGSGQIQTQGQGMLVAT
jgi:hypothetical protein